uniref:Uncharacterized protein n=1 Tax=Escherichia coli TaxID=562 RepID=A0A0C5B382_ECOLX|nr:hypothetical protein EL78_p6507 [Escherichia coli]
MGIRVFRGLPGFGGHKNGHMAVISVMAVIVVCGSCPRA